MALFYSTGTFFFLFSCTITLITLSASVHHGNGSCFTSIISFGDSLADTGNLLHMKTEADGVPGTRAGHFPYGETYFGEPTGRCSNGRLIIDFLAESLGLPFVLPYIGVDKNTMSGSDFRYGVNFAVAGATALDAAFLRQMGIPTIYTNVSLSDQLSWFRTFMSSLCSTHSDCSKLLQSSLILMGEIGGNDFNNALIGGGSLELEDVEGLVSISINAIMNAITAYFDAMDEDTLEIVKEGPYIPTTIEGNKKKPKEQWRSEDKRMVRLDRQTRLAIFNALDHDVLSKVQNATTAKEAWDGLIAHFEGNGQVKENRLNAFMQEFEIFQQKDGESIKDLYNRFVNLLNRIAALGKVHTNKEKCIRFLKALGFEWETIGSAFRISKDLNTFDLSDLCGDLITLELEKEQKNTKTRQIALQAVIEKEVNVEIKREPSNEEKAIALIDAKFKKFFKNNDQQDTRPRRRSGPDRSSRKESSRNADKDAEEDEEDVCYYCKKPGHYMKDCRKRREDRRKDSGKKKEKGMVAQESWSDDSSSDEEETANLCLMADDEEASSSGKTEPATLDEVCLKSSTNVECE